VSLATAAPPSTRIDLSDAALRSVTERLAETAEHYDRTAEFPWRGIHAVHEVGLLTAGVGERWGGRELSAAETVRLFQALGEGDPAVALITAMTVFQHAAQAAAPFWPDPLYERVLADSAERPVLINAIRAEPELGAPARGGLPATTLRRGGAGWVLDGRKGWATGSEGLAYHLVWAVTDEAEPRVGHVIVPADAPGIEIVRTWNHLGLRASSTHDVVYRGVEVPREHFAGTPLGIAPDRAGWGGIALGVPALYLGVARAAQSFFVRFAHERVPAALGRSIASTERIQSVAGEIEAQLIQAEEVLFALATRIDAGDDGALARAGAAKLLVSRAAIAAVQAAVAAIGNPGLSRANPLERHLRDVLCSRPHPPQDDAALIALGRSALVISRSAP
jgi:alkylation response protein AidB-like acyl-CoA dehydrogenase